MPTTEAPPAPPRHPRLVLLSALLLPGTGHVLIGQAQRGLTFLFFIIVFGWVGNRLLPEASFYTRHVGGIFLYGLSVIDAYKRARVADAVWRWHGGNRTQAGEIEG